MLYYCQEGSIKICPLWASFEKAINFMVSVKHSGRPSAENISAENNKTRFKRTNMLYNRSGKMETQGFLAKVDSLNLLFNLIPSILVIGIPH